jgi:23S rRNA (uracil1939-C5)-methyltransferase
MLPSQIELWLDLYAGAGIFTAALYPRLISGVLIERVASGLWAAEKTFAGISNITMKTGNVEDRLGEVLAQGECPDAILVDPPRSGLHSKVAKALCLQPTSNLVYVSCQPKTLARDIKHLTQSAFDVVEVVPVDMFPHTPHLEVVTHLQPKSG